MNLKTPLGRYSYLWVTLVLFLFSLIGHWTFGWHTYVAEQEEHNEEVEVAGYMNEMLETTFENWQSEFFQLMWQVGGLAFLFYVGSPQSKEGDDRKEEKLDLIIEAVVKNGSEEIKKLDKKYARK
jgi:hypothetical protein